MRSEGVEIIGAGLYPAHDDHCNGPASSDPETIVQVLRVVALSRKVVGPANASFLDGPRGAGVCLRRIALVRPSRLRRSPRCVCKPSSLHVLNT